MAKEITFGVAMKHEIYKLTALTLGMIVGQIIFSVLGSSGFITTIFLYIMALFISNMFYVDAETGKLISLKEAIIPTWVHWTGMFTDTLMVAVGMVLWVVIGAIQGIEAAIPTGDSPDDLLRKLAGGNVLLKFLYAFISHFSLMSFLRIWTNFFNAIGSIFSSPTGPGVSSRRKRN